MMQQPLHANPVAFIPAIAYIRHFGIRPIRHYGAKMEIDNNSNRFSKQIYFFWTRQIQKNGVNELQ